MMKIAFLALCLLLSVGSQAQTVIETPTQTQPTAFAIVIDNATYRATRNAVMQYRDAVQQDGLAAYIVRGDWKNPDEVKTDIAKVYRQAPALEGIVLVGDIPVAMIRNAQHMTTAFKMNETTFPFPQSSVPSDRFYDDLHLKFKFIRQDSVAPHLFYYELAEDSPQTLNPTFYSARIKYPEAWGGDKYQAIADFLEKAARLKQQQKTNRLDEVVSFNGGSYNSDCLVAWMDEEKAYRENFPLAFRNSTSFKHWNFRMDNAMKYSLFDELQRPEADLFMFHEHGLPTQQLINNEPVGDSFGSRHALFKRSLYHQVHEAMEEGENEDSLILAFTHKYHLTTPFWKELHDDAFWQADSTSYADMYINPADLRGKETRPTFVMFDACYNGSFHESDYLAAYYLFNNGTTVVAQGNTRNVLQDRWTIEMIGLLSHGVRVGQYNRLIATLEGHLLGDPTVRFSPLEKDCTLSTDITLRQDDIAYWQTLLEAPYADVQSLALRMIADADPDRQFSKQLLHIFRHTPFNTVRMEALKLLSRYNNADFTEAVAEGLEDAYELVARQSANYAGEIGDTGRLLKPYIRACIEDTERQRVNYLLSTGLPLFPQSAVQEAIENYYASTYRLDAPEEKAAVLKGVAAQFARIKRNNQRISDPSLSPDKRISAIRLLRNNPYHPYVEQYLQVLQDEATPTEVRVALAEALGWFIHSVRRTDIAKTCRTLLQTQQPEALRQELIQTLGRLEQP